MHEDLTERLGVSGIRIRFYCRIIPVIFNPCEGAIRIELIIIPVRYSIERTIPFDGDAVHPGILKNVLQMTKNYNTYSSQL